MSGRALCTCNDLVKIRIRGREGERGGTLSALRRDRFWWYMSWGSSAPPPLPPQASRSYARGRHPNMWHTCDSLAGSWQGLLFSFGHQETLLQEHGARNMEINKIDIEKFDSIWHESSSRDMTSFLMLSVASSVFPMHGAASSPVFCCIWEGGGGMRRRRPIAVAWAGCLTLRSNGGSPAGVS